jgi:hypothetical protein
MPDPCGQAGARYIAVRMPPGPATDLGRKSLRDSALFQVLEPGEIDHILA